MEKMKVAEKEKMKKFQDQVSFLIWTKLQGCFIEGIACIQCRIQSRVHSSFIWIIFCFQIQKRIEEFLEDAALPKYKFEHMDKVYRAIV